MQDAMKCDPVQAEICEYFFEMHRQISDKHLGAYYRMSRKWVSARKVRKWESYSHMLICASRHMVVALVKKLCLGPEDFHADTRDYIARTYFEGSEEKWMKAIQN